MSLQTWGVFAVTEIALCLTPGPAVLFVVSHALRYGGMRSLWANAGVLAGNTLYFALSATGLGALLLASNMLFRVIKWIGAAYLIVLGISSVLDRGGKPSTDNQDAGESAGWKLLSRGFVTQVANPKALVFFTALLPQFIHADQWIWPQILILGVTSLVVEFLVLCGYGLLSGRAVALARRPGFARLTNRVSGTLLIGAGAGLAVADTN